METTLKSAFLDALRDFGSLLVEARKSDNGTSLITVASKLEDDCDRLKLWAGSSGICQHGTESLEYRLQDSSHVLQQISRLLTDLKQRLHESLQIVSGETIPWDQLDDIELPSDGAEPETEIEQIALDITEVVDSMLQLSVTIQISVGTSSSGGIADKMKQPGVMSRGTATSTGRSQVTDNIEDQNFINSKSSIGTPSNRSEASLVQNVNTKSLATTAHDSSDRGKQRELIQDDDDDVLVIGIDFGTTFSAVAWSTAADFARNEINLVTSWPGSERQEAKAPTELFYEDGQVMWGYDIPLDAEPVRWFKLLLVKEGDLLKEHRNSEPLVHARKFVEETEKKPVELIADYLRALFEHTLYVIRKARGHKKEYIVRLPPEAFKTTSESFGDPNKQPLIKNGRIHFQQTADGTMVKKLGYEIGMIPSGASLDFAVYVDGKELMSQNTSYTSVWF
ncbi:Heat shock 70 kDa protein 12B [Colletotrichum sp. SAR 10_70]|nr:Heat shock 70 kDa protein 12B [Colletotrichum sp. SAR 10_71]KAI8171109.1 Heat shock 70 kDa protein 12B [Colletotrichum sp. SAR 10_70]